MQPNIKAKFPLKKKEPPKPNLEASVFGLTELLAQLKTIKEDFTKTEAQRNAEFTAKIQEIDQAVKNAVSLTGHTKEAIESLKNEAIDFVKGLQPQKGDPGENADEQKIIEQVLAQIPKPADINLEDLVKTILEKIPKTDEKGLVKKVLKALPESKASLKIIQEKIEYDPMSVIEKIMQLPEGKFKIKATNVDGLQQTIDAFKSQLSRGYLHGGGMTNPMTTKGDIIYESAALQPTRLGIGTIGQVLTVSAGGLPAWSTPASGGVTSINTLTGAITLASGTNITITPSGNTLTIDSTSVATAPAGSTTQIQFNNAGTFGASANLAWNGTSLVSSSAVIAIAGSTALAFGGVTGTLQVQGTTATTGTQTLAMFSATSGTGAELMFYRSRNAFMGNATAVASGNMLGKISFYGAQQSGTFATQTIAAQIRSEVDGTVTSGASPDMPGRLVFLTTPDGSGTLAEVMRISSAAVVSITGTLTVSGHVTFEGVTSTGATGTGKLVFDTNPNLQGATMGAGTIFDFSAGSSITTSSVTAIDVPNRGLYDASNGLSFDWQNRYLYDPTGVAIMIDYTGTPNAAALLSFDNTNGNVYFKKNINLSALTRNRALTLDSAYFLAVSATTDTELGYVSGVTSAIQTQLDTKPTVVGTVDLTNQGAAIGATTAYAVVTAGQYLVTFIAKITTVGSVSSVLGGTNGFQVKYTDQDDGTVVTSGALVDMNPLALNSNTTQTIYAGQITVNAKSSTNIQYLMDYTSVAAGTMKYNLHIRVVKLN